MLPQNQLIALLRQGKVAGFTSVPKAIETVLSHVFVFDQENTVLKLYKRDNTWFNTAMRDLSQGEPRRSFIQQDFAFNQFLNPSIYRELKVMQLKDDVIHLVEPTEHEDELVIVMNKQDLSYTLTDVLARKSCSLKQYRMFGRVYAHLKRSIPRVFLPDLKKNWYEQFQDRLIDLEAWARSEERFPQEIRDIAMKRLRSATEEHRSRFEAMGYEQLVPTLDCNPENLLFDGETLSFMDAYPPKNAWRAGAFAIDILRNAGDVYALVGKEAYESYMSGVREVAPEEVPESLVDIYLLYGAMITTPYFLMLSHKNQKYQPIAEQYLTFIKSLVT